MQFKERRREDPRPELTSLVDIMFILIIFLTVTTTFATSGGINVNLPEASSQRQMDENKKLYVVINRDGGAFLDGAPVNDAALAARLRALAAADPTALVIIEADKTVPHGRVVAVMDMAQVAGLQRLAIATEQKAPPPIPVLPAASPPASAGGATAP